MSSALLSKTLARIPGLKGLAKSLGYCWPRSQYQQRLAALEAKVAALGQTTKACEQEPGWDELYKDFERSFRGAPAAIAQRLQERYGQLLAAHSSGSRPRLMDLGSGQGELLSLGKGLGFKTLGVDQSEAAVRVGRQEGHEMIHGDLAVALEAQRAESLVVASCLHVLEHCDFAYCSRVLRAAHRSLKPGGILLIETPSLYSLWASARQFYLDPTHMRPLHPESLQFLAGRCGFRKGEVREFGPVQHPEACDFTKVAAALGDKVAAGELAKLGKWLYGPMDLCCIFTK